MPLECRPSFRCSKKNQTPPPRVVSAALGCYPTTVCTMACIIDLRLCRLRLYCSRIPSIVAQLDFPCCFVSLSTSTRSASGALRMDPLAAYSGSEQRNFCTGESACVLDKCSSRLASILWNVCFNARVHAIVNL